MTHLLLTLVLLQPPPVTADDLARTTATLRLMRLAQGNPADDQQLRDAVREFLKANPEFNDPKVARELGERYLKNADPTLIRRATEMARTMAQGRQPPGRADEPQARDAEPEPTRPRPRATELQQVETTPQKAGPETVTADDGNPPNGGGLDDPDANADGAAFDKRRGFNPPSNTPDGPTVAWWEKNIGPLDRTPAFREILREFLRTANPANNSQGGLGKLLAEARKGQLGEWATQLMRSLGGLDGSAPSAEMPGVSTPGLPDAPSAASVKTAGIALAAAAAVAVMLYFGRRFIPGFPAGDAPAARFTRPRPGSVVDRASLVRGFEQLCRYHLGRRADPLHHLTLAGLLADATGRPGPTGELADLYERARYASDAAPLTEADFHAARTHVATLTEGPRR